MSVRFRRMGRRYESDADEKAKRLNRESLHTFGRLLRYVRPYRKQMTFSIILLLFSTLLGLVLPCSQCCSRM